MRTWDFLHVYYRYNQGVRQCTKSFHDTGKCPRGSPTAHATWALMGIANYEDANHEDAWNSKSKRTRNRTHWRVRIAEDGLDGWENMCIYVFLEIDWEVGW